jgi:thymidylate synthase/dihydrofolate reductase
MIELILAKDKNNGIGFQGNLPWRNSEELAVFKVKTMNCILICGRKTYEKLPLLSGRTILVASKTENASIDICLEKALHLHNQNAIFVIGGAEIYNEFLTHYLHLVSKIHVSNMFNTYSCDTFIPILPHILEKHFKETSKQTFGEFDHCVYEKKTLCGELQYLSLLSEVYYSGNVTFGRNGNVKSLFGKNLSFDLTQEFPLLTTKKMFLRGIIEELLFFLNGETNSKILEAKDVNIWKMNTEETNGFMGPMYGSQWRHFNAPLENFNPETSIYEGGFDQYIDVLHKIKVDPKSRRILMTTFNPAQANDGVLYPCHSIVNQFYVDGEFLDMTCYNRSSDLFLGLPFNIASSSLLLMIIAHHSNLKPRYFHLYLGDCHIYEAHNEAVQIQLHRIPKKPPTLEISPYILKYENFHLQNYESYSSIKALMIK